MATTTNYSWTTPDNTAYVKDGASAIRTLGSSVDTTLFTALGGAYPGLRLIKKQTIETAVSSVAVTSAFSATYENYKIVISGGESSTTTYLGLSLTGGTSAYDYGLTYIAFGSSTNLADQAVNNSAFAYAGAGNSTNGLELGVDVFQPFLSKFTYFRNQLTTSTLVGVAAARHKAATSYTGFTVTAQTGTLTGGTIYVYGYGAS